MIIYVSKFTNILFTAIYAYSIYFDYNFEALYKLCPGFYLSKFVWLTFVNLNMQLIYNFSAALVSLLNLNNKTISCILHFIATSLVFPVGLTVSILFWSLYYLDPSFLLNDDAEIVMSIPWFNHCIHTLPVLAMSVDFLVWRHNRPAWKVETEQEKLTL